MDTLPLDRPDRAKSVTPERRYWAGQTIRKMIAEGRIPVAFVGFEADYQRVPDAIPQSVTPSKGEGDLAIKQSPQNLTALTAREAMPRTADSTSNKSDSANGFAEAIASGKITRQN